jgi:hypothetical protein
MTMEIDALYAGLPMRNSLDPCTSCSEWQAQAERVRVLREALELAVRQNEHDMLMTGDEIRKCRTVLEQTK